MLGRRHRSDLLWGYAMIAPLMIGLIIFYFYPVLRTLYFSFMDWGAFSNYSYTGFDNYKRMLSDKDLFAAFRNTFVFIFLSVPVSIFISIIVAVLLNQKVRGLSLYRMLYFLPVITMPAAVAAVWKWLYNADYGLINYLLKFVGVKGPHWLTDPNIALFSIIAVAIWSSIGYNMIIFLSGLQGISSTYYEVASLDGASAFKKFFHITLPLLTPTIFFVLVISLISAFQVFDLIFMMIGDITINATMSVVYLFYSYAFEQNAKGYAAAISILLFSIILIFTALQMKFQKKWVHYE